MEPIEGSRKTLLHQPHLTVHQCTRTHAHKRTHNLLAVHTHTSIHTNTQPAGCVCACLCECLSCACVCVSLVYPSVISRINGCVFWPASGRGAFPEPAGGAVRGGGGWEGRGGAGGLEGWGGVSNRRAPSNSLGRKKNDKKNASGGRWGSGRYCYQYLTLV